MDKATLVRMTGLIKYAKLEKIKTNIDEIIGDFVEEGFDKEEIHEYLTMHLGSRVTGR